MQKSDKPERPHSQHKSVSGNKPLSKFQYISRWIAFIAVSLCAILWFRRLDGMEVLREFLTSHFTSGSPPQVVSASTINSTLDTPLFDTVMWRDPMDPRAIPLRMRGGSYLFETQAGLQIWNSETRSLSQLALVSPQARLDDHIWTSIHNGVQRGVLFGITESQQSSLIWLREVQSLANSKMLLPVGFSPSVLLVVNSTSLLICSKSAKQSLVVKLEGNALRIASPSEIKDVGLQNYFEGELDGLAVLTTEESIEKETHKRPLAFNLNTCSWSAYGLPEPLASAQQLELVAKELYAFSAPAILAASWHDPISGETRTLKTPLVWNHGSSTWIARQSTTLSGVNPAALAGVSGEESAYAASMQTGQFAFLSAQNDHWQNSNHNLPPNTRFKLLPFVNEGVLALLIDAHNPGRIYRLNPEATPEPQVHKLSTVQSTVALADGNTLVFDDLQQIALFQWRQKTVFALPKLPLKQNHVSGLEMHDGSVLVFGSAPQNCEENRGRVCVNNAPTSFRWLARENRWATQHNLTVNYARGFKSTGNQDYGPRNDFLSLDGASLYFMEGNDAAQDVSRNTTSQLFVWQETTGTRALAKTNLRRHGATLLALNNGRLALVGGLSTNEPASPACVRCQIARIASINKLKAQLKATQLTEDDEEDDSLADIEDKIPPCSMCASGTQDNANAAFSCEFYERQTNVWQYGPASNHPGGRALKLSNGKIFKLARQRGLSDDQNYVAEVADAELSKWFAIAKPPIRSHEIVRDISVFNNRVYLFFDEPQDHYLVWDDDRGTWQSSPLPQRAYWSLRNLPTHFVKTNQQQLFLLYTSNFEYLNWPPL